MRIGELAGLVGVNPATVRYYERRGLLRRPARTTAGYRSHPRRPSSSYDPVSRSR
jgi:MerR family transcriptional regulator, mercuric resistance operon regulatory protein